MANDLDRLFRETLDQYEVAPKASSWDAVAGEINSMRSYGIFFKAAAAVITLLIAAGWFVWKDASTTENGMMAIADHPVQSEQMIGIAVPEKVAVIEKQRKSQPAQKPIQNMAVAKEVVETAPLWSYANYQIIAINEVNMNEELPLNLHTPEGKPSKASGTIKITYIASNEPTNERNKISGFISQISQEVQGTHLLADIRDAKDNLFSRN
ncbi:MAG: hypothetical protein ACJAVY_001696 [Marinoscillum sp.]|jgi:hypothetical protein